MHTRTRLVAVRQRTKLRTPSPVLVGTAAGFVEGTRNYDTEAVPKDAIVIHGSADETVPLDNVLAWAEPQDLPVIVVPGADHFFHRRLHILREIITHNWRH